MTAPRRNAVSAGANDLGDSLWMPFTAMRQFRAKPLMLVGAEGMYYRDQQGRRLLDAMAGLWCVNAGHAQPKIVEALRRAAGELDFVSSFRMSHPGAFAMAERLAGITPAGLNHVFFVNSGSEAVDTALKIARAYHRCRGDAGRTKLIGRAKAYHGMGWGGLSVSGIGRHKRDFGPLLPDVDHLPLPYRADMAFSRGQPEGGADFASDLEALLLIQDPTTVAAVIVEPVIGSGGVYPPPKTYLNRLRAICDKHGVLLILDEVITGFGRLGKAFASQALDVKPDIMTCAKGLTNGAIPMGATIVSESVYDAFMAGPPETIELMHGYTYSAHPLACAAGIAAIDVYEEQGLFERVNEIGPIWEEAVHSLRDLPHVRDIRSIGLLAAIDIEPRAEAPGARGAACADACYERGVLVRASGDLVVLSPPLIVTESEIAAIREAIAGGLRTLA
jgi:beta-alanine--pyruvate transaminase